MERMIHLVKVDFGFIDSVLQKYDCDMSWVFAFLLVMHFVYFFLPMVALIYVADLVGESEAELYGVATFYENFSMNEKGKYIIKVCNGTACHVRKSDDVQEAIYAATGLTPEDHISSDGLFTIERVACLGACSLAPVCTVNGVVHASMTPEKAHALIQELREAESHED